MKNRDLNKISLAGLLVALGIVFGDIGTSPLYVMNAIIDSPDVDETLILGALSCIFWTLTLQTTVKYVIITLKADNKGEGGIFALYALVRKKRKWVYLLAILGASMLFADGIITPAITVTSAIEGLEVINPGISVIPIVIIILFVLFLFQQFGTEFIGKTFGPIMIIWFSMLFILGFAQLIHHPFVFKALNPYYVYMFLHDHPEGFVLLGAVFLSTTGAEALYSDLGHCGFKNIRISWIFVKISLMINYLGQGAWILTHSDQISKTLNPFFIIVPSWFVLPSVIIATMAAVIASQALISGTFTLISEAIPLNFWPKLKISHPTVVKGQIYIPVINWFLFVSTCLIVLYFENSSNMEAAYGLAITITMIATTLLLSQHLLINKKRHIVIVGFFVLCYLTIEISFLIANLYKFTHGGWITLLISGFFILIMFTWYQVREIKKNYFKYFKINDYLDIIKDISKDKSIPKYATNLVYLTRTDSKEDIESKIIYSIIYKSPKRADKYWLIHVNYTDDPAILQYEVKELIDGVLFRIDLNIGFKIRPKINLFFRKIIENMVQNKEISLISGYDSLKKHNIPGDYKFIMIDRIHSSDLEVKFWNRFLFSFYQIVNRISISDIQAFGLDTSNVILEKVPLHVNNNTEIKIKRI
jgi:KUP system potassium uptake protein